jgi:hypothetical protein
MKLQPHRGAGGISPSAVFRSTVFAGFLIVLGLGSAFARTTTSRVLCECGASAGFSAAKDQIGQLVLESRTIGKVVAVVFTHVALDTHNAAKRVDLAKRSVTLIALINDLGITSADHATDYVEASPTDYGCKGKDLAVVVEFIYDQ